MTVVFCADGSRSVGLGHLQRCATLAGELRRRGASVSFAGREIDALAEQWLCTQGFGARRLPGWDSGALLDHGVPDRVIADSYGIREPFLRSLLDAGVRVLVIDELADRPLPATWLTNSCVAPDRGLYAGLTGAQLLLGPAYALLRDGFAGAESRPCPERAGRFLVTLGGSDPANWTPRVLRLLGAMETRLEIRAVVGALAGNLEECRREAKRSPHRTAIILGADARRMADLMRWADLAVSGAGQTLFELYASGCPCVALQLADNQRFTGQLLERIGAGRMIWRAGLTDEAVLREVGELAGDRVARERMSRAGRAAVDGLGAKRLADILLGADGSEDGVKP